MTSPVLPVEVSVGAVLQREVGVLVGSGGGVLAESADGQQCRHTNDQVLHWKLQHVLSSS